MNITDGKRKITVETNGDMRDLLAFLNAMVDITDEEEPDELTDGVDQEEAEEEMDELLEDEYGDDVEVLETYELKHPETTEFTHLISVGYDEDSDVISVTHDANESEFSVPAALCFALSLTWPNKTDLDRQLKTHLHQLGEQAQELVGKDVETDN